MTMFEQLKQKFFDLPFQVKFALGWLALVYSLVFYYDPTVMIVITLFSGTLISISIIVAYITDSRLRSR